MRIKRAVNAVKKRRKILKSAKGYFGAKSKLYRTAREQVMKSGQYAYIGRKQRKEISELSGSQESTQLADKMTFHTADLFQVSRKLM